MNEKEARIRGLRFTGDFSGDEEYIKDKIRKYKIRGYKAYFITERTKSGGGYSIYIEKQYFIDRRIEDIKEKIKKVPITIKKIEDSRVRSLLDIKGEEANLNQEFYDLTGIWYKQIERED